MTAESDFEKYDQLDAEKAQDFLLSIEDAAELRVFVAHEKENKDRSTVLTDEVIEKALVPSEAPTAEVEVPDGVVPGETPGWPIVNGIVIDLPDQVREELAAKPIGVSDAEEGDTMSDVDDLTRETITSLLQERRGYEQYGTPDQVAAVDAELKRLGYKGKAPAKRAATRKQDKGTAR